MYTHNKIAMNKKTQLLKSFQGNWKVSLEAYVFRVKKKQEIVTKYFCEYTLQLLGTDIGEIKALKQQVRCNQKGLQRLREFV